MSSAERLRDHQCISTKISTSAALRHGYWDPKAYARLSSFPHRGIGLESLRKFAPEVIGVQAHLRDLL